MTEWSGGAICCKEGKRVGKSLAEFEYRAGEVFTAVTVENSEDLKVTAVCKA